MTNAQRLTTTIALCLGLFGLLPASGFAGFPDGPPTKCAPDAVLSGPRCLDKFEASVWRIPAPTGVNKGLVKKIRQGKATVEKLLAAGATLLGGTSNFVPYEPCGKTGVGCTDIFAVSLPGVEPAAFLTWFQAQQACKNVGKQLPRNEDWQAAVVGTPDPGPDNGTTDCNTTDGIALTGSRNACVSNDGAFDMVGNLSEWTAEWVTRSGPCNGSWNVVTDDKQCFIGAATSGEPGVLVRGGSYDLDNGSLAGPLMTRVEAPSLNTNYVGFRCIR